MGDSVDNEVLGKREEGLKEGQKLSNQGFKVMLEKTLDFFNNIRPGGKLKDERNHLQKRKMNSTNVS